MDFFLQTTNQVLDFFKTNQQGLSDTEIQIRIAKYGYNELPVAQPDSWITIFIRQFKSPIIYLLLISMIAVALLGETTDSILIGAILLVNAIIGAAQEGHADQALRALRNLVTTKAVVVRDGIEQAIPDREVVPGDIVVLREGDKVPADGRIFYSESLVVDESALTGESLPVRKDAAKTLPAETSLGDQVTMVFRGTLIVSGTAQVVITATGIDTVIGGISKKLVNLQTEMPLQKEIAHLSKIVVRVVLGIMILIFIIGIIRDIPFTEMLLTMVAVGVSAVPEGLPIVVTVVLALGVVRMARQNALVKRLQAVEALGQAKVIAVDKTGTVTMNQMMVTRILVENKFATVTGDGYQPIGSVVYSDHNQVEPIQTTHLLAKTVAYNARALVAHNAQQNNWERVSGDPTDAALLVLGQKLGYQLHNLEQENQKILEIPFTPKNRFSLTVHKEGEELFVSCLGAPEVIIEHAESYMIDGTMYPCTPEIKQIWKNNLQELFQEGLRVIACATTIGTVDEQFQPNHNLVLIGCVGITDSIRPEVYSAVTEARHAGVKVIMITGDHKDTAIAIARKAGIYQDGDRVLTGGELGHITDQDVATFLENVSVFARVSPDDKLKIIELYQKRGDIIAMTGDGVNDALSLAAADLGVAMGQIGTEVAKESADIILLKDDFGNIVSAIHEGRAIYATIRNVLFYLFTTNLGEVLLILFALIIGLPLPIIASQILWLNFVTDGLLVVALSFDRPDRKKTHVPHGGILSKKEYVRIGVLAIWIAMCSLGVFMSTLPQGYVLATTATLTTLTIFQWFRAWSAQSDAIIFTPIRLINPWLVGALSVVIGLQVMVTYVPFFQRIFEIQPISIIQWCIFTGIASSIIFVDGCLKWIIKKRS